MKGIVLYSNTNTYDKIMHYLYEKYTDHFNIFEYVSETFVKNYEYGRRCNKLSEIVRICNPLDSNIDIDFNDLKINVKIEKWYDLEVPHQQACAMNVCRR